MKIHTISLLFKLHLKENCERIYMKTAIIFGLFIGILMYAEKVCAENESLHTIHAKKLEVKYLDARLSHTILPSSSFHLSNSH